MKSAIAKRRERAERRDERELRIVQHVQAEREQERQDDRDAQCAMEESAIRIGSAGKDVSMARSMPGTARRSRPGRFAESFTLGHRKARSPGKTIRHGPDRSRQEHSRHAQERMAGDRRRKSTVQSLYAGYILILAAIGPIAMALRFGLYGLASASP